MEENYYQILGVKQDATFLEIKKAYLALAKKYHPDMNKEKDAEAMFKKVTNAYEHLKDEKLRNEYDNSLGIERYFELIDLILGNVKKGIYSSYSQAKTLYEQLNGSQDPLFYYAKCFYLKYVIKASQDEVNQAGLEMLNKGLYSKYVILMYHKVLSENISNYKLCLDYFLKNQNDENNLYIGICYYVLNKKELAKKYLSKRNSNIAKFFLGKIYYEEYKIYDAEMLFLEVVKNYTYAFSDFYIAKIYIKQSNIEKGEKYLKLAADNGIYYYYYVYINLYDEMTKFVVEYQDKISYKTIKYVYQKLLEMFLDNDFDGFSDRLHTIAKSLYEISLNRNQEVFNIAINLYREIVRMDDKDTIKEFIPILLDPISKSNLNESRKNIVNEGFEYIKKLIGLKDNNGYTLLCKYFEKFELESYINLLKTYTKTYAYPNYLLGKYYFKHSNYYTDYLDQVSSNKKIKNDPIPYLLKAAFKVSKAMDLLIEIYLNCHNIYIYDFMMTTDFKSNIEKERMMYGNFLICLYNVYLKSTSNQKFDYKYLIDYIKRLCQINVLDYFYKLDEGFYFKLDKDIQLLMLEKFAKIYNSNVDIQLNKRIISNNEKLMTDLGKKLKICPYCGNKLKGIFKNRCSIHKKI